MIILQFLWSLLSKSMKKVFTTLFGWAVTALFGHTRAAELPYLSAVVAAAAAWPVLAVGVFAPRVATFALSFVPLRERFDDGWLRAVWLVLAAAVPFLVGVAFARHARAAGRAESRLVRLARGFPLTLGIAAAFLVALVTVPVRKALALARKTREEHLPLVVEPGDYPEVAEVMERALREHGFAATPGEAAWSTRAPTAILRGLGGPAFRAAVPARLRTWSGGGLVATLHPNGATLTATEHTAARARGILAEALVGAPVLQTADPSTQAVEKRLRRVWRLHHARAVAIRRGALDEELASIAAEVRSMSAPYDDWEIVYRETLQVARAVAGRTPLLQEGEGETWDASPAGEASALTNAWTPRALRGALPGIALQAWKFFGRRRARG